MSVDDESYAFGKAKQQVEEMLKEFNEHAPYGQSHRRYIHWKFPVSKEQIENIRAALCNIDYGEVRRISDPKNYTQYRL